MSLTSLYFWKFNIDFRPISSVSVKPLLAFDKKYTQAIPYCLLVVCAERKNDDRIETST